MALVTNGAIYIPEFTWTGNPGEYTIVGGLYTSVGDSDGTGAYVLTTDFVLYVPISSMGGDPLVGQSMRYKITSIDIIDTQAVNLTISFDDVADGIDYAPTNGSFCIISSKTPIIGLGFPVSDGVYESLPKGSFASAYAADARNIVDGLSSGGNGGPGVKMFVHHQLTESTTWSIVHNKNSVDFVYTILDTMGNQVLPNDINTINANSIEMTFLQAMAGKTTLMFI